MGIVQKVQMLQTRCSDRYPKIHVLEAPQYTAANIIHIAHDLLNFPVSTRIIFQYLIGYNL